jgi:hypothetical protein
VFLGRGYLEVTPPRDDAELSFPAWFLRPDDLDDAAEALRAKGLPVSGPNRFQGVDGTWLDVVVEGQALPTLTRRVDGADGRWPRPPEKPHPNGSIKLAAVHVRMGDPAPLVALLEALGARTDARSRFELSDGGLVAVRRSHDEPDGVEAVLLQRSEGPLLRLESSPV